MNVIEIKKAIEDGKKVHWSNEGYEVIKDSIGQYFIQHDAGNCIGLTWTDGVTLNGGEEQFFIEEGAIEEGATCMECEEHFNDTGEDQTEWYEDKDGETVCERCHNVEVEASRLPIRSIYDSNGNPRYDTIERVEHYIEYDSSNTCHLLREDNNENRIVLTNTDEKVLIECAGILGLAINYRR